MVAGIEANPWSEVNVVATLHRDLMSGSGLEVWPESHWPGFALRQADVFQTGTA